MKQTTLGKLADGSSFQLSKRSLVIYEVITKNKGTVTFTSMSSNKSFTRPNKTVVYI